jgi:hypothetical protein
MTHAADPHGAHGSPVSAPFSDAELNGFHRDDVKAGGAVAGLMLAIFCLGVVLYLIVLYSVAS